MPLAEVLHDLGQPVGENADAVADEEEVAELGRRDDEGAAQEREKEKSARELRDASAVQVPHHAEEDEVLDENGDGVSVEAHGSSGEYVEHKHELQADRLEVQ